MKRLWERFDFGWLIVTLVIGVVATLMMVTIIQLIASSECRDRGGVPVREMWGKIACAKPMERM